MILPAFARACYYAAAQKYGYDPTRESWPDGGNQLQPRTVTDWRDIKEGGVFALLMIGADDYLALLPLVGDQTVSWFAGADGALVLHVGTLGTGAVAGDLPLLSWARADSLYAASEAAWRTALAHPLVGHSTRPRSQKSYPEIFEYLGWCSWEEYKRDVDEQRLIDALATLGRSTAPVRFVLVDDCHHDVHDDGLVSFEPNEKFPNRWSAIQDAREQSGIDWLGLWLNFNGYWNGIAPHNRLGSLNDHLTALRPDMLQPREDKMCAQAYFDAMIGAARRAGFDFVKVDNQSANLRFYAGAVANPVAAAVNNNRALEMACGFHQRGLINCMAHSNCCAFNTRLSAVTRSSEDYFKSDRWQAKVHVRDSFGNTLWLGQTVWPDHDMFHARDPVAPTLMALSRALSGGPVYLSDPPDKVAWEPVRALCLSDGRVLRPLAPGVPLPESVFVDPFVEAAPYRVIAPLNDGAAALAAFNLTEPEQAVAGEITAADYAFSGAMLQDGSIRWAAPDEGLLLFDWQRQRVQRLDADSFAFELAPLDFLHALLVPIASGWAVVGAATKFLAPQAVRVVHRDEQMIVLHLPECLDIWVWSAGGSMVAVGGTSTPCGEGMHVVTPHLRTYPGTLRLERR